MENNINPEETGLADELNKFVTYTPASKGQRFLNWLIDNLFMQFALMELTSRLAGPLIVKHFPELAQHIASEEYRYDVILVNYLFTVFNYLIYYIICEKAFRGYTLGKFITGTAAISDDGQELTFKQTVLRSLSRLVPLEALSGLGDRPWHDKWTNTTVVKVR
jgi:uncharacterized RDD family membrane protein YckC